jgi:serine/threonine-protein kinase
MSDSVEIGAELSGTYRIVKLLGRGGMGAVWEATHLRLPGKRVAVKVLHGDRVSDETVYARFRREAEIASRLGHPNIVEALDFNTLPDGAPYIVLEYLEGETLAARIRRGPLPLDEAMAIARQIGSALAAAHRAGVVHRDLKPDNVFLCPTDSGGEVSVRVKVLDFGISKIRDSHSVVTSDSTVLGTPQYMSPEQASAKHGEVDGRTDQFALAAIVYEMLSGQAAFAGPTMVSVIYKVMAEHPTPLPRVRPQVSAKVGAAVERALSKDAGQRFPDIAAFVEALTGRPLQTLGNARDGDGHRAAPADSTDTTFDRDAQASPRPPRAALIFAGGAFLVAVAAVTAVALHGPRSRSTAAGTATATATVKTNAPAVAAPTAQPTVVPPPRPAPVDAAAPSPTVAVADPTPHAETRSPSKPGEPKKAPDGKQHQAAIPPEVAEELAAAEKALDAGDLAEAIRVAQHSLQIVRTPRAFAIMARAYCRKGDLEGARIRLPNVGGERARVLRDCKAAGVELQ